MSLRAVLFDLDDTLLSNPVDTFLPAYFDGLSAFASSKLPRERFVPALLGATEKMVRSTNTAVTNFDVFWQAFNADTGLDSAEMVSFIEEYYLTQFGHLERFTQKRPLAVELVRFCEAQGWPVVIATNPLMPRLAIEQRLAWAGVPVTAHSYALVTTMENMHSSKPHPDYYREILQRIGLNAPETLMVGDSWKNDIAPAHVVGCQTFWIAPETAVPEEAIMVTAQGSLATLAEFLRQQAA